MEKYGKLSIFIILIPTPDFPHFYYMLGRNLGSLLYGDVRRCSHHGGITWSYKELNSLVFNYAMYTTAESSILHMTYTSKESKDLFAVVYIASLVKTPKSAILHMTKLYPRAHDDYLDVTPRCVT